MVLPLLTWSVRCQDLAPALTLMRCCPPASCKVVGVLPTKLPSTSISAAATEEVTETVAAVFAGGAGAGGGAGAAALATTTGAGAGANAGEGAEAVAPLTAWFESVNTSKDTPR